MGTQAIRIGLLGLGTVGSGVVKLLQENGEDIATKVGCPLRIERILVRDKNKPRPVAVDPALITDDPADILEDPAIEIVAELIGGLEPAREFILRALEAGKNVVTANKDVLAVHGQQLLQAAEARGLDFFFEASVGGGIPIIHPLKELLAANRIRQVLGIVNGTTNFILTKMTVEGKDFAEALGEAQAMGYAESDPSADVEGADAARKLAILASIAFNTRVTYPEVYAEGIGRISARDILYAGELGYVIKLLAIGREEEQEVEVRVHPALVPKDHPLATVSDVFNAIFIRGDAVGEAMFYGRGAGQMPTASAVVGDLMLVARNLLHGSTGRITCTCYRQLPVRPMGRVECKYYLRFTVKDRPGVLARIAGAFGEAGVSLASVIQKRSFEGWAELVLITHRVREENLQRALAIIRDLPVVKSVDNLIRVEEGI
ncbi:MAG: homoserine dehydrogenase [Clostridia bacterium]|nr:homoserine dehydrogenase [Clostridia bacterium]MDH7572903.1 homoserine dehydrogenase [Clostridia bacterium]